MATAKPVTLRHPRSGPGRIVRRVALWGIVPVVLALAWFWGPMTSYARTGASYGARMACSCRYVAGRTLSDCRRDLEPGMAMVMLSDDDEAKSVTARVALFAGQTATLREGEGCVLQSWAD
jgi:hypothetical protein